MMIGEYNKEWNEVVVAMLQSLLPPNDSEDLK
jgi:hypothetical protein